MKLQKIRFWENREKQS